MLTTTNTKNLPVFSIFVFIAALLLVMTAIPISAQLPACTSPGCSGPVDLHDCIWTDTTCGGATRFVNQLNLTNVLISSTPTTNAWGLQPGNVSWHMEDVTFDACAVAHKLDMIITDASTESVSVYMNNITVGCSNDHAWILNINSELGRPVDMKVGIYNLNLPASNRFGVTIVAPTINGSSIEVNHSTIGKGFFHINATDIDVMIDNLTVVDDPFGPPAEWPVGFSLISAYRPKQMAPGMGPVIPDMRATILNSEFNVSRAMFNTEKGFFKLDHTSMTQLRLNDNLQAYFFRWETELFVPMMPGGTPAPGPTPPPMPKPDFFTSFTATNCNFYDARMHVTTTGRYSLRMWDSNWIGRPISVQPRVVNNSIDEYLLDVEFRRSVFRGGATATIASEAFILDLWMSTDSGGGYFLLEPSYCQGIYQPNFEPNATKRIKVDVFIEDSVLDMGWQPFSSDRQNAVCFGCITSASSDSCTIDDSFVNIRLAKSQISGVTLTDYSFSNSQFQLEIDNPDKNVSTTILVEDENYVLQANRAQFYIRNINSRYAGPNFECRATSNPLCNAIGVKVDTIDYIFENAQGVGIASYDTGLFGYRHILPLAATRNTLEFRGVAPGPGYEDEPSNGPTRRSPFNVSDIAFAIPWTGNGTLTDIHFNFHNNAQVIGQTFRLEQEIVPFSPISNGYPNADYPVLGQVTIDAHDNSFIEDNKFHMSAPLYKGFRVNITDSKWWGTTIVLNESLCTGVIPTFPNENQWNVFRARNTHFRMGGDNVFDGLIQDFTTCSGYNLFMNTVDSIHEAKFGGQGSTMLYTQFNYSYMFPDKMIVIQPADSTFNGTISQLVNFADTPSAQGGFITELPPEFMTNVNLIFNAVETHFNFALPSDAMSTTPASNGDFTMFRNMPAGTESAISFEDCKFHWHSGIATWINGGAPNTLFPERRYLITGYTPSQIIFNNTDLMIEGANMTEFTLLESSNSSLTKSLSFIAKDSNFNILLTEPGNSSTARLLNVASGSSMGAYDYSNGIGVMFQNSNIKMSAAKVYGFSHPFEQAVLSDNVPFTFTSRNTTFDLTADGRVPGNQDSLLRFVKYTLGTAPPFVQLAETHFNINLTYVADANTGFIFEFHQIMGTAVNFYMTENCRVDVSLTQSNFFTFLSGEHHEQTDEQQILHVNTIINESTFNVNVPEYYAASTADLFIAVFDFRAATMQGMIGPNVKYNMTMLDEGTLRNKVYFFQWSGKTGNDGQVNASRPLPPLSNLKINGFEAHCHQGRGNIFDFQNPEHVLLDMRNMNILAVGHRNYHVDEQERQWTMTSTKFQSSSVILDNVTVNATVYGINVIILGERGNNSYLIENSKFYQVTPIDAAGSPFLLAAVIAASGTYIGGDSALTIQMNDCTVDTYSESTISASIVGLLDVTCSGNYSTESRLGIKNSNIKISYDAFTPGNYFDSVSAMVLACPDGNDDSCDFGCVKMALEDSTVTIQDNRGLTTGPDPPVVFYSSNTTKTLFVDGNTFNVPQYLTWFSVNKVSSVTLFQHNTVNFHDPRPAETTMVKCRDNVSSNCPTWFEIVDNTFVDSQPLNGWVPITSATDNTTGTVTIKCNKLINSGVRTLWNPNPSLITYTNPIVNNTGCFPTRSHTMTILPPTTATNATTNVTNSTTTPTTETNTTAAFTNATTTTTTTTTIALTSTTEENTSTTVSSTTTTTIPITSESTTTTSSTTTTTVTPAPTPNVTETPVKAQAVVAAQKVQDDTTTAVSTVGAGAGLIGLAAPSLATVAARAGMISKLASCEPTLDQELPRYINPLGLEVDLGAYKVRYHVGAVVGGLSIILGFALLTLLFAVVHSKCYSRPEERKVFGIAYRSLGAARFPGSLVFFLLFFSQPFIGSSLIAIFYGNTASAALCVFVIIFTIGSVIFLAMALRNDKEFLAVYRTREDIEFDKKLNEREIAKSGKTPIKEEEQSTCERFDKWYEDKIEGVKGWWYEVPRPDEELPFENREKIDIKRVQSHEGHKYFLKRFGAAYDYYTIKYRWFVVLELCASLVLGLCDGLVEVISCDNIVYILVALFAIYVLTVFCIRPFATRKDFFFCGLVSFLQLLGGIFTILPEDSLGGKDAQERAVILVCSSALFVALVQAAESIFANTTRFVAEKFGKEETAPIDYNVVTAAPAVLNERSEAPSAINDKEVPLAAEDAQQGGSTSAGGILQMPSSEQQPVHTPSNNNADFADMPLSARQKAQSYMKEQEEMRPVVAPPQQQVPSTNHTPTQQSMNPPPVYQQQQQHQPRVVPASSKYDKDDLDEL